MAELSTLASPKIFFIWNAERSTFLLCQEAGRNSREIPFASKNADLKVRCLLYSPHPHDPQGWASNLTTGFFAMIFLLLSSLLWWLLKLQPRARKTSNCWDHSKRSSSIFCLTCVEHFHALNLLQERNTCGRHQKSQAIKTNTIEIFQTHHPTSIPKWLEKRHLPTSSNF